MEISLDITGRPAEVRVALQRELARARRDHPHAGAVGGAISDALSGELAGLGPDDTVTIKADVSVTTRRATVSRLAGQPLVRGEDGLVHGDPLPDDPTRPRIAAVEPGSPNVLGSSIATERRSSKP